MDREERCRISDSSIDGTVTEGGSHWDVGRRPIVRSLGVLSVATLAGCLGGNDGDDSEDGNGDGDDASTDDEREDGSAGDADRNDAFDDAVTEGLVYDDEGLEPVDGCDWEDPDLVAHDVAGTGFVVIPSFPAGWELDLEKHHDAGGELRYGDPAMRTEDGRTMNDIYVSQSGDTVTEEDLQSEIDAGILEEAGSVEIGGEERLVTQMYGQGAYLLAVPSPIEGEYYELLVSGGGTDECGESVVELAREVVDALVVNPETTL